MSKRIRERNEVLETIRHCSKEFTRDTRKEHSAVVGEKAALTRCSVSRDCHIADRTTLTGVYLGQGTRVQEKVRITNSVIMDNVLVETGSVLEDCIVGDGCVIREKSGLKMSVLGRKQTTEPETKISFQLLLDKDRMIAHRYPHHFPRPLRGLHHGGLPAVPVPLHLEQHHLHQLHHLQ